MNKTKRFIIAATVAVSVVGVGFLILVREPTAELTRENLEEAREKWEVSGVSDYRLAMLVRGATYEIRVVDGVVVSLIRDGVAATSHRPADYAVDGWFDTLERELELLEGPDNPFGGDRTTSFLRVRFHPRWGYVERYVRAIGGSGRSSELQVIAFEHKLQRER